MSSGALYLERYRRKGPAAGHRPGRLLLDIRRPAHSRTARHQGAGHIHGLDPTVGRTVAGLAWVVDGITEIERHATEAFHRATIADPAYAQMIASLRWAADDITEFELYAVDTLRGFARRDHAFAQTIISLPWVIDDITEVDQEALLGLNANTPETARQLLEMVRPPEELADDPSQWDIQTLAALARLDQETLGDLANVAWFTDGLNDEERALLTVLPLMRRESPHVYNNLVHSRHTLPLTVSLPLAGRGRHLGLRGRRTFSRT